MKMKKVALIVVDALGIGAQPDAAAYGDAGADTFGHVYRQCQPDLPNLADLGLLAAAGIEGDEEPLGCYGKLREAAAGKDTTTGHWEIAGLRLEKPFPTYPHGFPRKVMDAFEQAIGRKTLGNKPASGTAILDELGEEHMRTGYPIVYTSADSVFQIACHEDIIPVEELYHMCEIARAQLTGDHTVGG